MGILAPMAIWIMKKDVDPKVDFEGKKILNYQILWTSIAFIFLIFSFSAKLLHVLIVDSVFFSVFVLYITNALVIVLNTFKIASGWKTFYLQAIKVLK